MVSVKQVSFKGESNLLKQATSTTVAKPYQTPPTPPSLPPKRDGKKLAYVSSAIAIASLGVTRFLAVRQGKLSKQMNKVSGDAQELMSTLSTKVTTEAKQIITELSEKLTKGLQDADDKIKGLGKWQDGQIQGVRDDLSARISEVAHSVKAPNMEEILVSPVHVNGMTMDLATVANGYGKHTGAIEKELRSEATKRIFGIVDRTKMTPSDDIVVRVPTSEFKGFSSTGGMSVVPKEVVANLGAIVNGKQNARLVVDTPMYLGQVEDSVYYSIQKRADGLYDYISTKSEKPLAELEKIDTMKLPIYTDKGRSDQFVELYMARNQEQVVDLDLLVPWLEKDLAQEVAEAVKTGEKFDIEKNMLRIKYDPDAGHVKPVATVKYDALLYKHDKFRMDGPVVEDAKTIYNNLTHESGETERFTYFSKFFYEYLIKGAETSSESLKADLILGNDWQTGGISAMMKLLTTVRKHFGMDPKVAEKLYNTPVMTLMHNAGLAGDVWHSQPKLLNVLFGEHSAMITKNAWMPKGSSLADEARNGLFHGTNLNPQTMAAAYSDILTPVSKGYGNEMASHSGFGGANHDIFRMRARYHEYGDIEHLKYIARQNDLDPNLVPKTNTTYKPITNGCDKVNNMLTTANARKIEKALGLEKGSLRLPRTGESILTWHKHNKSVYLNKVIHEVEMARTGKGNPMKIGLPEMTDLTGVTADTMVVSTAGRIADQKGLDIFAEAIEEFLTRHKGEEPPVFYVQGVGGQVYVDALMDIKRNIANKFGKEAANRIVYAKLFNEAGRYDGCKLMSDFTVMSSWFEPCGLVHKEIAAFSGSIPIVNKVGGLTDGLEDGVNAIFSEFKPKFGNKDEALQFNKKAFADALDKAFDLFKDKAKYADALKNSFEANHSWLKNDGPMEEYAKVFVDYKVLKPEVIQHS
ncbi:glycogen/starch synthase [bacterium]|nr:glycogen/starch synthase [bacterium]